MPSGWEVYYVVLLSAVFSLSIPLTLRLISLLISSRAMGRKVEKTLRPETTLALGRRINTRFFLGANISLLLISFGLILIPCVGTLNPALGSKKESLGAMVAVLSLVGFAALGLLYAVRKGDLNWLKALRGRHE